MAWSDSNPTTIPNAHKTLAEGTGGTQGYHNYCRNPISLRGEPWCYTSMQNNNYNYGLCSPLTVASSPDNRFYSATTVTIQASAIETAKAATYFLSAKDFLTPYNEHAKKEYRVQVGCFTEANLDASLKYKHDLQSGATGCTCQNPSTGQLSSEGAISVLLCATKCY